MMHKLVRVRQSVTLLLSVLLAACLALGLCFIVPVSAHADGEPAFTYIIGDTTVDPEAGYSTAKDGTHYNLPANGWAAAVAKAVESHELVLVKLASDWTAFDTDSGFGTDASAFQNGALYVPAGANVAIDLCGKVLNRYLETADENGGNIVTYGALRIYDSSTGTVTRKFSNESGRYVYGELLNENDEAVVTVECKGGLITGGYSTSNVGGGGISVMSGSLTVENVLIAGNASTSSGGGVYVATGAELTVNNSKILYNTANNGGGLYLDENTTLTVSRGEISHNTASTDGGAMQAMGGSIVNISDSTVSYNSAQKNNGGIYSATLVIENSTVSHNRAIEGMYGGIYASKLTLKDSTVSENSAGTAGGGISSKDATVIDNSLISKNVAGTRGGGIYANAVTVTNNSEISENTAQEGGGLYLESSESTIENSTIEFNNAEEGGGLYHTSDVVLNNATVRGNIARLNQAGNVGGNGGGIYNSSNNLTVKGLSVITANNAENAGGGIYVMNLLYVSGDIKITDNKVGGYIVTDNGVVAEDGVLNNVYLSGENKIVPYVNDEVLSAEAEIGVTPYNNTSLEITAGYGDKYINNADVADPAEWFVCDAFDTNEYVTVLDAAGEARFIRSEALGANWSATYEDSQDIVTLNGYGISFEYGEKALASLMLNDEDLLEGNFLYQVYRENGEVAARPVTGTLAYGNDSVEVAFYVYITPKTLTDANVKIDKEIDLTFDGTAKTPVIVSNGETPLNAGSDYSIEYTNNINAGEATAVITGMGNYVGSITTTFTITKDDSLTYTVSWEYLNGGEWTAVDANTAFTYNAASHDGSVRAVLNVGGIEYVEYVYAKGYAEDAENANANLYLVFAGTFENKSVNSLVNATTYTVTIAGAGNAVIPANTQATVKVNPADLGFNADDFEEYKDANGNRLWLLSFNGTTTTLRDKGTTYYDPNEQGNTKVGDLDDAYARYNGSLLTLGLNGNYMVGEHNLSYYLDVATVSYSGNTSTGAKSATTLVTTLVTLTFNANYTTNTITLAKNWYVVNINNSLRGTLSHNEATLSGWRYGDVNAEVLRPEHGDYAIYTIGVGGQTLETFAVVFNGSNVAYYNVKTENDVNVPDTSSPYSGTFTSYLETLGAGNYVLTVYVPEYQVTAQHRHWWDGTTSGQDDENAIYHSITSTFPFTVNAYSIAGLATDSNLEFTLTSNTVSYNGSINNAPESVFTLKDKTLVLGVDYELRLDSANVGTTRLTVVGKGGLTGEYRYPGDIIITKATNSWAETPNVVRWVYGTYEASFNEIYATPNFLDDGSYVQFTVTYDGETPVAGLESFTTDNGLVSDEIAEVLAALPAGTYYLVSKVAESANYHELTQNPMSFHIAMATNTWAVTPNVIQWQYKGFNQVTNLMLAQPKLVSDDMVTTYKVTSDEAGTSPVAGLGSFTTTDGIVSLEIANILNNLAAGTYYLTVEVSGNTNFTGINSTVSFEVTRATNMWTASPTVQTWVTGRYNEEDNKINAEALFGTVQYVIYLAGDEEVVIYDTAKGINELKGARVGTYVLSAYVSDGSANYTDLQSSMVTFEIFAPEGLPWWATLIIVVVALGAAALILYILHEKGILQMLTGKVILAMRTRATIDATIAAIRANKRAEEAKISIAEAEARDAEEARKKEEEEAKKQTEAKPKAEKQPSAKKTQNANEKDVTSQEETPKDEQ